MTSHYIDIQLRADPEISTPHLLGALFDHLHLALVEAHRDDIGVSFPGYALSPRSLGSSLRLHGSESALQSLADGQWLKGMRDHARINAIRTPPGNAGHRIVHRRQFKTNVDRLRRRRMKRKGETREQATRAIPDSVMRKPDLPYIHVHSRSTAQPFCLFVAMGPVVDQPVTGTFNSYGFSSQSTIPWF